MPVIPPSPVPQPASPGALGFLQDLWLKHLEDDVSMLVSGLAYYTFFSFFPLLLLLGSLIGFTYGMGEEYARLPRELLNFLPFSADYLAVALEKILKARRGLGLTGSILLLWSATAAFDHVQQMLNRIHKAPTRRPLWRRRLLSVLLGIVVMMFVPLSVSIAALRPVIALALMHQTIPGRWSGVLLSVTMTFLGIVFNFILLLTIYLFGPSVHRRFRQTWPGALTGAVLWEASKAAFGLYIRSLNSYAMLYGSVGSIIAVLLWLYVSGTIFALGAEVNSVLAMRRESRRREAAGPVPAPTPA